MRKIGGVARAVRVGFEIRNAAGFRLFFVTAGDSNRQIEHAANGRALRVFVG